MVLHDSVRFRAETADCELATWAGGLIEIGAGTTINYGTSIAAAGAIRIGRDCLVGTYVNIMDSTFHNLGDRGWALDPQPVTIGDRVWLGNRCMVMKGVTIGDGAVVAGCSLVTRDVPPNTMVVGVPARVVKQLYLLTGAPDVADRGGPASRGATRVQPVTVILPTVAKTISRAWAKLKQGWGQAR
jgi:acetyltransferase-like isoleucine patch superfamily enzyme